VVRRYYGGIKHAVRAAGGGLWLKGAVLNCNGYERSMRTGEIGGRFRSAAENKGQAGRSLEDLLPRLAINMALLAELCTSSPPSRQRGVTPRR